MRKNAQAQQNASAILSNIVKKSKAKNFGGKKVQWFRHKFGLLLKLVVELQISCKSILKIIAIYSPGNFLKRKNRLIIAYEGTRKIVFLLYVPLIRCLARTRRSNTTQFLLAKIFQGLCCVACSFFYAPGRGLCCVSTGGFFNSISTPQRARIS